MKSGEIKIVSENGCITFSTECNDKFRDNYRRKIQRGYGNTSCLGRKTF